MARTQALCVVRQVTRLVFHPLNDQIPPLPRRRLGLYLPRLSPAAAADRSARHACRRGVRLHRDAVEADRGAQQGRGTDASRGDLRCGRDHLPQRDVPALQGAAPAAARRPHPAVPADPRRRARLRGAVHRAGRRRGRRHHRLLCAGRAARGLRRVDRVVGQGPDAARPAGARPLRHDEELPDQRGRGYREVRRAARHRSARCSR